MTSCMTATAAAQCIEFNAAPQQGGFVWGKVSPGSVVSVDGSELDVLADGTTFLGFGRDAGATVEISVSGPDGGERCSETIEITAREYRIQRVEGVPAKTVHPPKEQLQRIRREAALVRAARADRLARPDLLQGVLDGFIWPVEGPISGVYGSQRYYNGEPGRPHYGVDVAAPTGRIVHAPAAALVTLAQPDLFYSGGTIVLDHGYLLSSSFLHMSKVLVKVGDEVKAGDIIGEVGSTGRATGPHLDWRMNWRSERIDPQLLAPAMPKPTKSPYNAAPE
ncbi:MAG: M23 family metallopeptidase [Proteobacteria bacterium]|nr:M23 family metallopeptidase [Pseudomonadota bacterium]